MAWLVRILIVFVLSSASVIRAAPHRDYTDEENREFAVYQDHPELFGSTTARTAKNIDLLADLVVTSHIANEQPLRILEVQIKNLSPKWKPGAFEKLIQIRDALKTTIVGQGIAQNLTEHQILTPEVLAETLRSIPADVEAKMNTVSGATAPSTDDLGSSLSEWTKLSFKIRNSVELGRLVKALSLIAAVAVLGFTGLAMHDKAAAEDTAYYVSIAEQNLSQLPKNFQVATLLQQSAYNKVREEIYVARQFSSPIQILALCGIAQGLLFALNHRHIRRAWQNFDDLNNVIQDGEASLLNNGTQNLASLKVRAKKIAREVQISKWKSEAILALLIGTTLFPGMALYQQAKHHHQISSCRFIVERIAESADRAVRNQYFGRPPETK
jgi:hypothetical protein